MASNTMGISKCDSSVINFLPAETKDRDCEIKGIHEEEISRCGLGFSKGRVVCQVAARR